MDSQKAANWSQIIGTFIGAIVLGYAVWDHLPNGNQSGSGVAWGDTMKSYVPPAIIALILFASSILQTIASRRRHSPPQTSRDDPTTGATQTSEIENLRAEAAKVDRLLDEKQQLGEELSRRQTENKSLARRLGEAGETIKQLEREKDAFQRELVTTKKQKDDIEQHLAQEEIHTGNWIQSCNKAEHELAELRWLESRMKTQGEQLDNWVRIEHVKLVKLQLIETPRMIVLALWVHNGSIFDITFDFDHVGGRLHFKNRPLNDPIRVPPSKVLDIVSPGGGIEIVIEQPLLATEAETVSTAQKIGDPNGIFWLGNLHIPICTIHSPQSFNNHKLRIHSEIELQYIKDFPCDN